MYISKRKFHNIELNNQHPLDRTYGIPVIYPQECDFTDLTEDYSFIGFNRVLRSIPKRSVLHFYLDDYQFERFWNFPVRYLNYIKKFDYVITPDFSVYVNIPRSIQVYNQYRNNSLACFLQDNGVNIIPCVQWGDLRSVKSHSCG